MRSEFKLGLLGNGIGRSRAKSLHEMIGRLYGLDVSYTPMDLAEKKSVNICEELSRCRDEGYRGVNVTHPFKMEAFKCLDACTGIPEGMSTANTVLFEERQLMGSNTDYSGFCRAFRTHFGEDQSPGKVLMLGTGGVGLAIAFGLLSLGMHELVVYDKNTQAAHDLLQSMPDTACVLRVIPVSAVIEEMQSADGLINATPVGMFQYPGNAFPDAGFAHQKWAFDAVYTPVNTAFLERCRSSGIDTLSGFHLFLYQGLDAFRLFTGVAVDADRVETAFLQEYPIVQHAESA